MAGHVVVTEVSVSIQDEVLLEPVTFDIATGTALAVVGPNGSGKTTLLEVLAGTLAPSSGTVAINGRPVDERNRAFRASVAAMIGVPPMARNLTMREHACLVATSWGGSI